MSTLKSARLRNLKDKHTEQEAKEQIQNAKESIGIATEKVELEDNSKKV